MHELAYYVTSVKVNVVTLFIVLHQVLHSKLKVHQVVSINRKSGQIDPVYPVRIQISATLM